MTGFVLHFVTKTPDVNLSAMQKITAAALCSLWFVVAAMAGEATNSGAGQIFQFKFVPNKPLIYAISVKTQTMNDNRGAGRSSLNRNTVESRYKIKLTAKDTNQDGTTTVCYEPFDFEQDIQFVGAGGETDTSIRGLDIVSRQNGILVMDTTKSIGTAQAQNMKQQIFPRLLSGYFDFAPAGQIKKFGGDLPFVDTWQGSLKFNMNIFYIVFPTNIVAVRDSWTNSYASKSAGGMVFSGDGIVQPWVYTREADQTTTNGVFACFNLCESDINKNMNGYFDQLGQQTSVAVPEHSDRMAGSFQFDPNSGYLVSAKKTDKTHDDFNVSVQGSPVEGHIDSDIEILINLISP